MNTTTEIKERPILFSTPMVKAILEGRKTVTRRVIKTPLGAYGFYVAKNRDGQVTDVYAHDEHERTERKDGTEWTIKCPYDSDVLWVRETWAKYACADCVGGVTVRYRYKADDIDECYQWKPSIHMPKVACRLKLEILSIGVERLQDITLPEVFKEGVEVRQFSLYGLDEEGRNKVGRIHFQNLWSKINGAESWEANPWVWRIEFKKAAPNLAI